MSLLTSLMLLLLPAAPVLAQALPRTRERATWPGLVAALVLVAAIAAVSAFSSKRGHQD